MLHLSKLNIQYSSVASYTGLSPGYRIYEVDSDTFKVVDTETWVLDLVTSNTGGADSEPVWYKLYTARSGNRLFREHKIISPSK